MKHKSEREWVLDDGSEWTVKDLSKLLGCTISSAYYRLQKSNEASVVLKPIERIEKRDGLKVYYLDDGSGWTAKEVAEKTGCLSSTASTRLSCFTDPNKVLASPLRDRQAKERSVKARVNNRMFSDPLGHWKLINRST